MGVFSCCICNLLWSTLALRAKNKLQTFDRNKLPLLRTLANEATNSQGPHNVLYKGS